jgi:flavin-binding protein dodecin
MTTQGERNLLQTVILVGTSPESWEKAAASVVEQASKTMMVVGVKVDELDTHISN